MNEWIIDNLSMVSIKHIIRHPVEVLPINDVLLLEEDLFRVGSLVHVGFLVRQGFLLGSDVSFRIFACQVFRCTVCPRKIDNSMSKLVQIHKVLRTMHPQSFQLSHCLLRAAFLSSTLLPINLTQLLLICIFCNSPKSSKAHRKLRRRCQVPKRRPSHLQRRNDRLILVLLCHNWMEKRVNWGH